MFACAPGSGTHMSFETFKETANLAIDYGEYIVLGGGEPTLNPRIIEMAAYACFISEENFGPFMVTNGTCSKKAWGHLIQAHKAGKMIVQVSKDPWHDLSMIKDWVWDDAEKHNLWWGDKGRRTIVPKGRAAQNPDALVNEAYNYCYDKVIIEDDCIQIRASPEGTIWVDGRKENYKIGDLSSETLDKAFELLNKLEEEEHDD